VENHAGFAIVARVVLIEPGNAHHFGAVYPQALQQRDRLGIREPPRIVRSVPHFDRGDTGAHFVRDPVLGQRGVGHDREARPAPGLPNEIRWRAGSIHL
jgi:hypothetical protein